MKIESAVERLHNICDALNQQLAESPFTQEEWDRIDAENVDMRGEIERLRRVTKAIAATIELVENRCMAADGPVTNTRHEMTDEELRKIWRLATGRTEP